MNAVEIVIAGVTGAAMMSIAMTVIHQTKWANADMVRALGSLATKKYENALLPGLAIHSLSGVLFAFPYAFALGQANIQSIAALTSVGALIGLVHGFVMSFVLLTIMSERHPLPMFRNAGLEVAAAHIVGHVVYGAGVGAMLGFLGQ